MRSIGPYQFLRFITHGSSGAVFECRHCSSGESVACKVIDLQNILNDDFYEHFKNELIIHSQVRHPGITKVKDLLLDQSNIYVIIELCNGGDLNEIVMKNGGLPERQARHYFRQIIEAMSYIHDLGVAHRDIKLENILVTSQDEAKLTDFGLCKQQTSESAMMRTRCGTLVYAAPEIIKQEPYNGMKADIWSAGIVLYAMIANHFPWITDNNMPDDSVFAETTRQIIEGDIQLPPGTWELQDLIASMLTVDPDERPTASDVMQHPWMEAGGGQTYGEQTELNTAVIELVRNVIMDLERRREAAGLPPTI